MRLKMLGQSTPMGTGAIGLTIDITRKAPRGPSYLSRHHRKTSSFGVGCSWQRACQFSMRTMRAPSGGTLRLCSPPPQQQPNLPLKRAAAACCRRMLSWDRQARPVVLRRRSPPLSTRPRRPTHPFSQASWTLLSSPSVLGSMKGTPISKAYASSPS